MWRPDTHCSVSWLQYFRLRVPHNVSQVATSSGMRKHNLFKSARKGDLIYRSQVAQDNKRKAAIRKEAVIRSEAGNLPVVPDQPVPLFLLDEPSIAIARFSVLRGDVGCECLMQCLLRDQRTMHERLVPAIHIFCSAVHKPRAEEERPLRIDVHARDSIYILPAFVSSSMVGHRCVV